VEKLTSQLLRQKSTVPRFRLPLTESQAADLLLAAYKAEVAYRHRTFTETRGCTDSIRKLAHLLTDKESPKFGVMLCGTQGNGKTTLLYALRSAVNYLSDHNAFADNGSERIGLSMVCAKDVLHYATNYKFFAELRRKPMLAVDDVGREPAEVLSYGNALTPLTDLIEYRYNNQLFTMLTTNLKAEEVTARYGRRIADRFNEMLDVIIFTDGTFRR